MTLEAPETVEVVKSEVCCDGGSYLTTHDGSQGADSLGHPTVFLNMGPKGWVECPYCDRRFVLKGSSKISQD